MRLPRRSRTRHNGPAEAPMDVHLTLPGRGSLTTSLYEQLLEAILDGRLAPGQRLPSTRDLADQLTVARSTVTYAYERLTAEGYTTSQVGSGTFVCTEPVQWRRRRTAPGGALLPRRPWPSDPPGTSPPPSGWTHDFSLGVPDPRLFPHETWRRHVARELRSAERQLPAYRSPAGVGELRAAIARHIGTSRAVDASPDDVIVTRGAQQALDLIARVLVGPGDVVAVEEPGYPQARQLFAASGAEVVGVPVDDEGMTVSALPAGTRLVYCTPSHQFPLGTPMSVRRRAALLDWASVNDAAIIEDDFDSEFRFGQRSLDPLQHLDTGGRVVYVGTFSKTLLPTLRLGFLVAPTSLRPALIDAKRLTAGFDDPVVQRALARLIDRGEFARHVRRVNRIYGQRHEQIMEGLDGPLAPWLEPVRSAAGLHVAAHLRPELPIDLEAVRQLAMDRGTFVDSLNTYYSAEGSRAGLVLGFGLIDDVPGGIEVLADVLAGSLPR